MQEAGCVCLDPVDISYPYLPAGRYLDLARPKDRQYVAQLIVEKKPLLVHLGTPCTKQCVLGAHQATGESAACNEFTVMVLEHQAAKGRYATVEQPVGSTLRKAADWTKRFGTTEAPVPP